MEPATSDIQVHSASRIWFGKVYHIKWNLKVKNIGRVIEADLENLLTYYHIEID